MTLCLLNQVMTKISVGCLKALIDRQKVVLDD
jgi:hypothetical protein